MNKQAIINRLKIELELLQELKAEIEANETRFAPAIIEGKIDGITRILEGIND